MQNPNFYFKSNILDQAMSSKAERFEKTKEFNDTQRFVFNIRDNKSKEDLLKSFKDLHQEHSDQNKD